MTQVLNELLDLLTLEKIEENIFRGQSQDLGFGNLFGGQVLGQSLSAATQTVEAERIVHSLHAYFLRPGDPLKPIVYKVERLRDGGSFNTRRITAIQHGKPILSMEASFQKEEQGFEHGVDMPGGIPGPEGLPNDEERAKAIADKIPAHIRDKILADKPIEIRPVNPLNPFNPEVSEPQQHIWFRPTTQRYINTCWPMPQTSACAPRACALTATPLCTQRCRWPAWITPCGSTAPSALTSGCYTPWTAPPP